MSEQTLNRETVLDVMRSERFVMLSTATREGKIDELWTEQAGAYFEQGRQDPNVTLLKVTGDSAQFWGVPGGAVGATLKLIGAKITGKKPNGASGTVEL